MDALSGRPVGGVLIRVNNGTPVPSDADGLFVVSFPGASEYRLSGDQSELRARLTFVRANDSSEVISLIPASFNLTAFDVSLRPSGIGLTRWMSTPALVVLTREIQYTSGSADSAVVRDHEISAGKLARWSRIFVMDSCNSQMAHSATSPRSLWSRRSRARTCLSSGRE